MDTLPPAVSDKIRSYLTGITLNCVEPRNTVLGMWRFRYDTHEITINNDLSGVQFMLILVHEIAHARIWDLYADTVKLHSKEWKDQYRQLMLPLLQGYFDTYTEKLIKQHMVNPPATTRCSNSLKRLIEPDIKLLSGVPIGSSFKIKDGRKFVKLCRRRVNWECSDCMGKIFIVS